MRPALDLEQERFSLDDPQAEAKLLRNLDARQVRLAFLDLCRAFGCERPDDRLRLRSFLEGLCERDLLIEAMPGLYCRPALCDGQKPNERKKGVWPDRRLKVAEEGEKAIAEFVRASGGQASTFIIVIEGERHGWTKGRIGYLLKRLCASGILVRTGKGHYVLKEEGPVPEAPAPPAKPKRTRNSRPRKR